MIRRAIASCRLVGAARRPKRGFRNAARLDLPLGHIGMVSGRARDLC